MTTTADTTSAATRLAEQLAELLRTYQGAEKVFAPDAGFDVNVPFWRFRLRGPDQLLTWLQGYAPHGYTITVTRVLPTQTGFVIELEGEYEHHGTPLFFRNVYVADVAGGLITDLTFWCTGDWDPETRHRYTTNDPGPAVSAGPDHEGEHHAHHQPHRLHRAPVLARYDARSRRPAGEPGLSRP